MTNKTNINFYDPRRDGVTQGLLTMWKECREKAWLFLQSYSLMSSSMALTYGTIVHAILDLVYTDIQNKKLTSTPSASQVKFYVRQIEKLWEKENPRADKKTLEFKETSFLLAEATLPLYFEFWRKDVKEMKWVGVENEFNYVHRFNSGITMRFRGKMDGLYQKNGLWLFETKCKSRIEEGNLVDLLSLDFQIMYYLWVAWKTKKEVPKGAKYNIVRRIGLEQKKTETIKQYTERCIKDIESRPKFYFIRYEISVSLEEMMEFERELETQCREFLDWWDEKLGHYKSPSQCETKYGRCNYLDICSGGNYSRYEKRKILFRELEVA